jgi:hypothetical protein
MAARQSSLKPIPDRPELDRLIEQARRVPLTNEQLAEQRASFIYGNAPFDAARITKESAREASRHNRLAPA